MGIAIGASHGGCLPSEPFPGDQPSGIAGAGGTPATGGTSGTGGMGNGGTAGSTGATTTTTTAPLNPACVPNIASMTGELVDENCGVFVSSSGGDDMNDGTKDKPFKTIAAALASPTDRPRYLCAEIFIEAATISKDVAIYGGLDCMDGWKWLGGTMKSEVVPDSGEVPLTVDTMVNVTVEDVAFKSTAADAPGSSSIGVIAGESAGLTLTRCDVTAGDAKDGADGEALMPATAPEGQPGNNGKAACTADVVIGGAGVLNECDPGDPNDQSLGGKGGGSDVASGAAGNPGTPLGDMNSGVGQLDDDGACESGDPGGYGPDGISGAGATALGSISMAGFVGADGETGGKGKPGQGGGGGGGAKGGTGPGRCDDMNLAGGASGGSGGAGGCGGQGGNGGQAGGSSIGIISLGATLIFTDVTIAASKGGNGGDGHTGQEGGYGGKGGDGGSGKAGPPVVLKPGCDGGKGGQGGKGGHGGGGRGGHSIGIAYLGMAPSVEVAQVTVGQTGMGGGPIAGAGLNGSAAKLEKFD